MGEPHRRKKLLTPPQRYLQDYYGPCTARQDTQNEQERGERCHPSRTATQRHLQGSVCQWQQHESMER